LMPHVLVSGARGQLGQELQLTAPANTVLTALPREALDITDREALERVLDHSGATAVINASAYTAVDRAEQEPDLAHAVNAQGPANLAKVCADRGLRLLHVSTDFVFDGTSGTPYAPTDTAHPLGVYGESKRAGELAVLGSGADAIVLRTGWVYSRYGSNFVKTMLQLMTTRDRLSVVDDQIGTPTWARSLAQCAWSLLARPSAMGVYHWSDAGACSWYDFACAIRDEALGVGLIEQAADIVPIPASDYPTPARRPAYSVLDKSLTRTALGETGSHWRSNLRTMLEDWSKTGE
jgi:dTDP-4-dehydrorhamnose reductase